jgi:hypothetical protein
MVCTQPYPKNSHMMTSRLFRSGPAILVVALHIAVVYVFPVSIGMVKAPTIIRPSEVVFVSSEPETQGIC